ncbi:MAG: cytochrome c [Thermoleophilia bacterium]|nr:cytochrome c [Thermoleophilia bacterium]
MKTAAALIAVLALLLSAACGGDDGDDAEPQPPAAGTTENGDGASGEAVFTQNCGSCHTLSAAGTSGTTGPDLDDAAPSQDEVEEQVRNGGGGMPAFEGRLSDDEIEAVSEYVATSAGG